MNSVFSTNKHTLIHAHTQTHTHTHPRRKFLEPTYLNQTLDAGVRVKWRFK